MSIFAELRRSGGPLPSPIRPLPPYRSPARWIAPTAPDRTQPGRAFATESWWALKGDAGRWRTLEYVGGGQRLAQISLRELHVPGLYRRWALLAEPEPIGDAILDQGAALEDLIALARHNRVDVLDCKFNMARWRADAVAHALDGALDGAELEDFGTYLVHLDDLDRVRKEMSSHHRRLLRKAERAAPEVRDTVGTAELIDLLDATYARGDKARPFGAAYLRRLVEDAPVPAVTAAIYADGVLQAAVIAPYDRWRGFYLHGATRARGLPGAAVLAHFTVMQKLHALGVPIYDLGGARAQTYDARLAGISQFKRRFGGPFEALTRWALCLSPRGRWLHGPGLAHAEALIKRLERARTFATLRFSR